MNTTKKLFLLDAYALIFRAYYAFINRPIRNSKGFNTSAIFGFVSTLDEVLRKEQPTHIAVAFDPPSPTFRHQLFKEYKANRETTPPDIKLSVPVIKEILEAYQIPILEFEGYEADDVIGTVSKLANKEGFKVYMMTPDKDYAQLIEEGIFMYKPRRSGNDHEIWGIEQVRQNFEVKDPLQVVDVLALWGDASDNIPGAPGIGEKTAKKLIAEYGTIENLLSHTDSLKGKLKDNILNFSDQILLSKKLATIDINVPINFESEEFKIRELRKDDLKYIFNELEFRTLSQRILGNSYAIEMDAQGTLFDLPTATGEPVLETHLQINTEKVEYQLITKTNQVDKLLSELHKIKTICFDTETTGLDVLQSEIVGLAIAIRDSQAWYIAFSTELNAINTLYKFKQLFDNKYILKVGHNLKFDIQILRKYGISVEQPYFDTMIAHYLLYPEGKHKLDSVTESLLNYKMIPIEELIGKKGPNQLNMKDIEVNRVKDYACEDADLTFRLYKKLVPELKSNNLLELAENIELPLIEVLTDMELAGFNLDVGNMNDYEKQLEKEIGKVEKEIYDKAGEEFNIASPKQLGIVLFEKLKISSNARMTKTKQYSTSEETLQQIKNSHPIINVILDYRSLTKLYSTYVKTLPKLIDKDTHRIHTSFNQTITVTGRLSSVNPNLQNIPIREERGREIRKAFIPASDEYILLSADYSQIELRLMAHMSGDQNMIEAFTSGTDIHRSTAAKIFKVDPFEVTREMRSSAKTANFGIIYGISAFGLSQRLNISRTDAKALIDNYFNSFPKVKEYMDRSIENAKSAGYVTTLFGRRRYLPDIHSANSVVRGVAERNAINTPIQGTAADIIKIAMISIHRQLKNKYKTMMILQVHDELVFDVYKPELEQVKKLVKYEMENVVKLKVPLEVEIGTGKNWLEAH